MHQPNVPVCVCMFRLIKTNQRPALSLLAPVSDTREMETYISGYMQFFVKVSAHIFA